MKRIIVTAVLLASFFGFAQQKNTLLDGNYWKKNPSLELVKEEISKGNNPAAANGGNHDVVSMAINNGSSNEVIKYLIDLPGNSVDKTTHDGRLYIHWAASKGNVELVNYLIEKGAPINRTDDKGATPLAFAAGNGQQNTEIFDIFFKAGIDPKAKYKDGATLMHLAIPTDSDLKIANYLISKGLSLKDTDDLGRTAFDYAARLGNVELLKTLASKGVKATGNALIIASQGSRGFSNTLDTYKYLVETVKLDPKSKGENGENVLHNLLKKADQEAIIDYFLSKNVDINAVDNKGNSAFMALSGTKNIALAEKLIGKVKDINAVNNKGESTLYAAIQYGSSEMVDYLINKGAKTSIVAKDGNLAHALVASYRKPRPNETHEDFVKKIEILKNNGVDFAKDQKDGSSLYHIAVLKNDIQLFKLLEEFKIDINAQDQDGMTALHKAAMMSKDDVILKHLLSLGAKKEIKTEFDETAYDLASENEYLKEHNVAIDFLKS